MSNTKPKYIKNLPELLDFSPERSFSEKLNLCFWDLVGLLKHLIESVLFLYELSASVKVQKERFMLQCSLFADKDAWTRFPANCHPQRDATQAGSLLTALQGTVIDIYFFFFAAPVLSFYLSAVLS